MSVFSDNSSRIVDGFSHDFEKVYLDTLSHRHGTKRVLANRVYQEYIGDKSHIHMNSTIWTTLTQFCKYLGREGKAVVDETEKGWYIQYIDRDPKLAAKQLQQQERKQHEVSEEERISRMIAIQMEAARAAVGRDEEADGVRNSDYIDDEAGSDEQNGDADTAGPVRVELKSSKKRSLKLAVFGDDDDEGVAAGPAETVDNNTLEQAPEKRAKRGMDKESSIFHPSSGARDSASSSSSSSASSTPSSKPLSHIDQLMKDEEARKRSQLQAEDKKNRKDYWLHSGIVVKIVNKDLAQGTSLPSCLLVSIEFHFVGCPGKYYKSKGTVERVIDKYVGEVRVRADDLDKGVLLRLDQDHLQTVVPKVGQFVMIVNGRGRGLHGVLTRIHEDKYNCDVRIGSDILGTHVGVDNQSTHDLRI
jgi:DNA/RNA-binding protein KIN17